MSGSQLNWIEYVVVGLSLVITLTIGVHFSKDGNKSLEQYMLGSRRMAILPVTLSIAATYLTGSSIVASCQEVYLYGLQISIAPILYIITGVFAYFFYLPVSFSIRSASSFEFFDRRYNNSNVRKLASIIYAMETIHHTAMSQYVPAISLSQASGMPVIPIACGLSLICVVYTASGGLKAVAWADSFQAGMLAMSAILLAIIGTYDIGGFEAILNKSVNGTRWEPFNFNPDPTIRYSIWTQGIGSFMMATQLFLAPSYHQRLVAMPTYKNAQRAMIWSTLFAAACFAFTFFIGIVVYANFAGCDPVLSKQGIHSYATILPHYVYKLSDKVPGIGGLFLSGVIAAGLSTTTSCWNTMACTIYEDIIKPYMKRDISKQKVYRILVSIVIISSIVCTGFIFVIKEMGTIIEATLSLKAMTISIIFVLYHAGMFIPWVSSKGAFAGGITSAAITCYIVIGARTYRRQKLIKDLPKVLTTAMCTVNGTTMEALNMTTTVGTTTYGVTTYIDANVPPLFRISMFYYPLPGIVIGLLVSYLVSLATGVQDLSTVDREMIVPQMRWVLPPVKEAESDLKGEDVGALLIKDNQHIPLKDLDCQMEKKEQNQ